MALLNQVFAFLVALLLATKMVSASFYYCIGLSGPGPLFGREVVGFQLWNDRGEEAAQYRSIYYARKTRMQNNGWYLDMKFITPDFLTLTELHISSDMYGDIGTLPFTFGCATGANIIYYGCYISDANDPYCNNTQATHLNFCRNRLQMGSDGVPC